MPPHVTVVGTSYVGLSLAVLLSEVADVTAYDIDESRLELLGRGQSPIDDPDIEARLAAGPLDMRLTSDRATAYEGADFVVVATPTDYDPATNYFNTTSVEQVVGDVITMAPRRRPSSSPPFRSASRGASGRNWAPIGSSSPRVPP